MTEQNLCVRAARPRVREVSRGVTRKIWLQCAVRSQMNESRKQVGATLDYVTATGLPSDNGRVKVLAVLLNGSQPNVPLSQVRKIFRALFIEELCFGFPVQPTIIEWSVATLNHLFRFEAALNKIPPRLFGIESRCVDHCLWH